MRVETIMSREVAEEIAEMAARKVMAMIEAKQAQKFEDPEEPEPEPEPERNLIYGDFIEGNDGRIAVKLEVLGHPDEEEYRRGLDLAMALMELVEGINEKGFSLEEVLKAKEISIRETMVKYGEAAGEF